MLVAELKGHTLCLIKRSAMNPLASTAESDAPLARAAATLSPRLRHRDRERLAAAGAGRRHGARHLATQARAEFLLKWRLQARALAGHAAPRLGAAAPHAAGLPGAELLLGAQSLSGAANAPASLAEVDPKLLETYEKLGVPLHERAAGQRGGRRGVRLGLGGHHLPRAAGARA